MEKCLSWLGHRYQARYSNKIPPNITRIANADIYDIEAIKSKIYERDICVRCGHVIERKDG